MLPELLASYISTKYKDKKVKNGCLEYLITSGQLLVLYEPGPIAVYALKSRIPLVYVIEQVSELVDVDRTASVSVKHICA